MNFILLSLALINLAVISVVLLMERKLQPQDTFSAGRVFAYFAILGNIPLIYFALNAEALEEIVFGAIDPQYRSVELVGLAYCVYIFTTITTYLGILWGSGVAGGKGWRLLNLVFGFRAISLMGASSQGKLVRFCWLMIAVGFGIYLLFVIKMGGLINIWMNLGQRQVLSAGLGYLQTFYMFTVTLGLLLLWPIYFRKKKYLSLSALLFVIVFMLASIGQRAPVLALFFSLMVVHHYGCRRLKAIFNLKNCSLVVFLLTFFIVTVQFRTPGAVERYFSEPTTLLADSLASIERHVIARFGRVERDIVIIQYFSENELWFGASYLSVLVAPIPRGFYEDKPPVDTGRYLVAMAKGGRVNPPVPTNMLPSYGWPDGNMAGYMNFHLPGLFFLNFLSGAFLGFFYVCVKLSKYNPGVTGIYALLAWYGGVKLSPMGIVDILTTFVWLFIWLVIYRLKLCTLGSRSKPQI